MGLFQNWFGKPTLTKELQSELQKLNYILENSLKEEKILTNPETRRKQINDLFKHKTVADKKELKIEKIIQETLADYKSGKRSCNNPAKIINLAQMG